MTRRTWTLADLTRGDREVAERVLDRLFATAPGSDEEARASAACAALDRAICERYGFPAPDESP